MCVQCILNKFTPSIIFPFYLPSLSFSNYIYIFSLFPCSAKVSTENMSTIDLDVINKTLFIKIGSELDFSHSL
jgi:hypothetical protein